MRVLQALHKVSVSSAKVGDDMASEHESFCELLASSQRRTLFPDHSNLFGARSRLKVGFQAIYEVFGVLMVITTCSQPKVIILSSP